MKNFLFNLNDKILVKLKPDGYKHYQKEYNEYLPVDLKKSISELRSKEDKDGYLSFQAWEFMRIFGKTIVFGATTIFETDIKISELYLKLNSEQEDKPNENEKK